MRARWVVALVVVTNLLTGAILVGWHWWDASASFDIAKWRANSSASDCDDDYRQRMVEDLVENYLEAGMSGANIRWLLGPPDSHETAGGEKLWSYDTGYGRSDCEGLIVRFGTRNPRVTGWSHWLLDDA